MVGWVYPLQGSKQGAEKEPIFFGFPPEHSIWGRLGQVYVTTSFHFLGLPSPPCPPGLEGTELPLFLRAETCMQYPEFSR